MNRSILIVICDFLVSAMLSMMTGMVPAHSGGTGVGLDENTTRLLLVELENKSRELENLRAQLRMAADRAENFAKLQEINAKLAENKMQQEALKETLKRTPANTGELSPQELKKLLDDERLARLRLEYEIRDRDDDLADDRQKIADLRTQTRDLRQDLRQAQGNVQTLTGKLVDANKQLADSSKLQAQAEARAAQTSEQLAVSRAELAETGAKLGAANAELSKAAEELRALSGKVGHLGDDNQKLRSGNAYLSGQLTTATRNLAEVRGQMENANTKISQLQLALDTTDRQKRDLQGHFRQAVTELSETKVELEKIRDNNTELQSKAAAVTAELEATKVQLEDMKKLLSADVLDRYSKSALALRIDIFEKRVLTENRGGGTYYLPLVKYQGINYLFGHFATLAGYGDRPVAFSRVSQLNYQVLPAAQSADFSGEPEKLTLLLYQRELPQLAALPVRSDLGREALEVIPQSKLKERGLERLKLFKAGSFGKEYADLGDRCSLDLAQENGFMFIRNPQRGTAGGLLAAEPGDFVLTSEGFFVGIVIDQSEDAGRKGDARVYLFPDNLSWTDAASIPLNKAQDEEFYNKFARQVKEVRERLEMQERKK